MSQLRLHVTLVAEDLRQVGSGTGRCAWGDWGRWHLLSLSYSLFFRGVLSRWWWGRSRLARGVLARARTVAALSPVHPLSWISFPSWGRGPSCWCGRARLSPPEVLGLINVELQMPPGVICFAFRPRVVAQADVRPHRNLCRARCDWQWQGPGWWRGWSRLGFSVVEVWGSDARVGEALRAPTSSPFSSSPALVWVSIISFLSSSQAIAPNSSSSSPFSSSSRAAVNNLSLSSLSSSYAPNWSVQ